MRITVDLIRKRAEHNNKEVSTLEEISLHQQDIEKIETIDNVCRKLQILYLQNNIIGKIENVSRLKELRYLNLALNNVQFIENLDGCEALEKLDLTVNFVGDLRCVQNLQANRNLRELYLVGNPCTSFEGYREYVICTLPQLASLDGTAITKTERILASQVFEDVSKKINAQCEAYLRQEAERRAREKRDQKDKDLSKERIQEIIEDGDAEKQFWQEESDHTPEARMEMHRKQEAIKRAREEKDKPKKEVKERQFFHPTGRPYNINEGDWEFTLTGEDVANPNLELDFACYRYLDTSQMKVDVQPTFVRIQVKDKYFQLALPEEVNPDKGSAKRSQITGHLLITMPKAKPMLSAVSAKQEQEKRKEEEDRKKFWEEASKEGKPRTERLEVGEIAPRVDYTRIVEDAAKEKIKTAEKQLLAAHVEQAVERPNDPGFVDNDDVPPLM